MKLDIVNSSVLYALPTKLGNKTMWAMGSLIDDVRFVETDFNYINVIVMGRTWVSSYKALTYKEATSIESKIDDGKADTDNVIAVCGTAVGFGKTIVAEIKD